MISGGIKLFNSFKFNLFNIGAKFEDDSLNTFSRLTCVN